MNSSLVLLQELFGISDDGNGAAFFGNLFLVELHSDKLVIQLLPSSSSSTNKENTPFSTIQLCNVIGCRFFGTNNADRAFLTLYAYPKMKQQVIATPRRRQTFTLFYDPITVHDRSTRVVSKWKSLITYLVSVQHRGGPDVTAVEDFLTGEIERLPITKRRLLILLNPVSGSCDSEAMFKQTTARMLQEAEIDYHLVYTEYSGHGRALVENEPHLGSYDAIITASGDGLFYEVINGLFSRADWQQAIRIPLGILPVGSANALSTMLCQISGEATDSQHLCQATFLLTRSIKPRHLGIMAIDTADGRLYSSLWASFGLISDIDIESEDLRFLGGRRFFIETLLRVCLLRKYKGKISFLLASKQNNCNNNNSCKVEPKDSDFETAELNQVSTPLMPPLQAPVPDNWTTIEDNFICVQAMRCSHLSSDTLVNPDIKPDDGTIWLVINRASTVSRPVLIRMLRDMAQGKGIAHAEGAEWYRVRAFRFEPAPPPASSRKRGYIMTVDGERVGFGPLQAQILPQTALLY